jgi:hypothetical protein
MTTCLQENETGQNLLPEIRDILLSLREDLSKYFPHTPNYYLWSDLF